MMSEQKYQHTFNTWNKLAKAYQDKFMDISDYKDSLDHFISILETGSKVLEAGCGPGNITSYLYSARPDLEIMAIDFAPSMIGLAKMNVPQAEFLVMDCRDVNDIDKKFEAIVCGFCIPYLNLDDCKAFIKNISSKLEERGFIYISWIEDDHARSGFEVGSTGDGTYVYYYDEAFMIQQAELNHLEIIKTYSWQIERRGKQTTESIYILRKK